jgi:ribulose-phosphate 3-epimerase
MDNHYVPNLSFGPMVCKALKKYGLAAPIDVHLMVEPVDDLIIEFIDAGATNISFHPEASKHVDRSLELIKSNGCKAGLVINPASSLSLTENVLHKLDVILLMSVNPGFGGQSFLPSVLTKIEAAREMIDKSGFDIRLEVDGGVNSSNLRQLVCAGADTFVMGSAIFGAKNYKDEISSLKTILSEK